METEAEERREAARLTEAMAMARLREASWRGVVEEEESEGEERSETQAEGKEVALQAASMTAEASECGAGDAEALVEEMERKWRKRKAAMARRRMKEARKAARMQDLRERLEREERSSAMSTCCFCSLA